MRIISGKFKGKRISAPKNLPVRPTTDFAKEGLFNILNNRVSFTELNVLDLFSGTGNIAFEFASRGAQNVACVDSHFACVKFINSIASELEFPIRTVKSDVFKFLKINQEPFDIIFADPPYNFSEEQMKQIVATIFENDLLSENGNLIIEHTKHLDLSNIDNYFESRRYGGSVFSFFQHTV